jgi:hypothetical protein
MSKETVSNKIEEVKDEVVNNEVDVTTEAAKETDKQSVEVEQPKDNLKKKCTRGIAKWRPVVVKTLVVGGLVTVAGVVVHALTKPKDEDSEENGTEDGMF